MTRSKADLDGRDRVPVTLATGALLVLLGGIAYWALRSVLEAEPPPLGRAPVMVSSPAANALTASPTPTLAPASTPEAPKAPPAAAAISSKSGAPTRPADIPYRFVGKSASGAETTIVLFGRGRVVTLHGPGPLDDEYQVDAVFDEYLVLRHVPTGVGKFLALTQRQQVVEAPRDPEDSPRD